MKKVCVWVICAILLIMSGTTKALAVEVDPRAAQMRIVLEQYNSPMVGLEDVMIATAEKYNLDWTLLAAIAGTESTFGNHMPANCVNPYGWGVYGDNKLCFTDFKDSIEGVAAGLSGKYNTTSVEAIAHTYNKVSTDGWIMHTHYFMNKIKTAPVPVATLPITL